MSNLRIQVSDDLEFFKVFYSISIKLFCDISEQNDTQKDPSMREPYYFWEQSAGRAIGVRENMPQNRVFCFHSAGMRFLKKKK